MRHLHVLLVGLAACFFLLQAGAASSQVTRQIPVTDDFVEGVLSVSGRPGVVYRISLIVAGGVIELCGAMTFPHAQARHEFQRVLRNSAFVINGRKVIQDLSYWNTVSSRRALDSAMANCRSTGVRAGTRIYDISIDWPEGFLRF